MEAALPGFLVLGSSFFFGEVEGSCGVPCSWFLVLGSSLLGRGLLLGARFVCRLARVRSVYSSVASFHPDSPGVSYHRYLGRSYSPVVSCHRCLYHPDSPGVSCHRCLYHPYSPVVSCHRCLGHPYSPGVSFHRCLGHSYSPGVSYHRCLGRSYSPGVSCRLSWILSLSRGITPPWFI